MILGGSSKFDLNKKSLDVKDIDKILAININSDNKKSHLKYSLVLFASNELERFKNSFEINQCFDYVSDFKMMVSIIEALVEANKLKELFYLVNNILKKNADQYKLNMFISDFLMLLNLDKIDLNEFFNISIIED